MKLYEDGFSLRRNGLDIFHTGAVDVEGGAEVKLKVLFHAVDILDLDHDFWRRCCQFSKGFLESDRVIWNLLVGGLFYVLVCQDVVHFISGTNKMILKIVSEFFPSDAPSCSSELVCSGDKIGIIVVEGVVGVIGTEVVKPFFCFVGETSSSDEEFFFFIQWCFGVVDPEV